jgi:dienelactone hydrolase
MAFFISRRATVLFQLSFTTTGVNGIQDGIPFAGFFFRPGLRFFVPDRRGHGRSPYDSYVASLYAQGAAGRIALHETHLEDQLAALAYLKQLSYVDTSKIAVAGCSYGGIQTVLALETNADQRLGLAAAIDFAGGAMSWKSLSLRERMVRR